MLGAFCGVRHHSVSLRDKEGGSAVLSSTMPNSLFHFSLNYCSLPIIQLQTQLLHGLILQLFCLPFGCCDFLLTFVIAHGNTTTYSMSYQGYRYSLFCLSVLQQLSFSLEVMVSHLVRIVNTSPSTLLDAVSFVTQQD